MTAFAGTTTKYGGVGINLSNPGDLPDGGIPRVKEVLLSTAATTDNADTITIDLTDVGMIRLFQHLTWRHTTLNSVLVREDCTVAIDGPSCVFTVGGSTANKARSMLLVGI